MSETPCGLSRWRRQRLPRADALNPLPSLASPVCSPPFAHTSAGHERLYLWPFWCCRPPATITGTLDAAGCPASPGIFPTQVLAAGAHAAARRGAEPLPRPGWPFSAAYASSLRAVLPRYAPRGLGPPLEASQIPAPWGTGE